MRERSSFLDDIGNISGAIGRVLEENPEIAVKAARLMVKKGAGLLDVVDPNWFKDFSLETLDFDNPERSVLGQVFGNENKGLSALNIDKKEVGFLGFRGRGFRSDEFLKQAWREEIRKRVLLPRRHKRSS